MPSLRQRCINSGSIRGIGVHTPRSFCRRYYRGRSRCILPSPISLGHKWERLRLQSQSLQHELGTILSPKCNITLQKWKGNRTKLIGCTNVSADIKMLQTHWCHVISPESEYSLHYSSISKETLGNKLVSCPDQWEHSPKSVSKQISAAADSLSLHILLSVRKREGSAWVRWGELSGSDRAGPLQESQS